MMLMVDVTMRSHEYSRTVQALDIGEDGLKLSLSAKNDERDLLARRFGLIGIRRLAAEVCLLQRANDDERIYLDGYLSADFVQNSVILSVCVQSKNMWTIAILSCSQVSLLQHISVIRSPWRIRILPNFSLMEG